MSAIEKSGFVDISNYKKPRNLVLKMLRKIKYESL